MATVLSLINKVLRELREAELDTSTTSLDSGSHAALILQYLNEAKEEAEEAWMWKALRTDITFSTVAGQRDYDLGASGVGSSATNERSMLIYDKCRRPLVTNVTEKHQMIERGLSWTTTLIAENQEQNQKPCIFSQVRANDGITLRFYPAPDAVYSMQATFYVPQEEFVSTSLSTVITIPSRPVWRMALAKAMGERGEGLGDNTDRILMMARRDLDAAIMRDVEDQDLTAFPY